jgi:hypothetical protein
MKLQSYFFHPATLVASLLLTSTISFTNNAQANIKISNKTYQSRCSFYGQNQAQAESIGCSIQQSSNRIVIRWNDGLTTTLQLSKNSNWQSMPSGAKATVRFYTGTGRVAQIEIFSGPGKGIIVVNP